MYLHVRDVHQFCMFYHIVRVYQASLYLFHVFHFYMYIDEIIGEISHGKVESLYLPEFTVCGLYFILVVLLQGNHSTIAVKKRHVTEPNIYSVGFQLSFWYNSTNDKLM